MELADRTHAELAKDNTFDTAPLRKLQRSFTANIERYIRLRARRGTAKRPTDMVDTLGALLGYAESISSTLEKMLDVSRYRANLPPIINDEDDEELDDASLPSQDSTEAEDNGEGDGGDAA
ncbi:hypothetical protein B7494_g8380 [Chlorociboria aeruginascens]|nr:hypothetical protein B7494_g8380 [Chlorociboria aeruginascens]